MPGSLAGNGNSSPTVIWAGSGRPDGATIPFVSSAGADSTRRSTFDTVAELYDAVRPRYPDDLIDAVVRLCGLRVGDRVLEVGSGTGIATAPLLERGLVVTCIELGARLAEVARDRLAGLPNVEIITADFETWTSTERFDAIVSATAWHWIDPAVAYPKAARLLRPGGHLAVWTASHVFPAGGDPFFREIQDVYVEIGEGLPPDAVWPVPDDLTPHDLPAASGGRFATTAVERFSWEIVYDADAYIDLLNTFSGHITMEPWQRERLYGAIRQRLNNRPDRRLRRGWGAVLEVAAPVATDIPRGRGG